MEEVWLNSKKIVMNIIIAITILVGFVFLIILDGLVRDTDTKHEIEKEILVKDLYKNNGLPESQDISTEVLYEDEDKIYYSDRILEKFYFDIEKTRTVANIWNSIIAENSNSLNLFFVPIPPRIVYEQGYYNDEINYDKFIQELKRTLKNPENLVDARVFLEPHKKEYLFFRTENSWTALSAYYTYNGLFLLMNALAIDMSDFEEFMFNSFRGNLYSKLMLEVEYETYKSMEGIEEDKIYYYKPMDSKNIAINYKTENGTLVMEKGPVISQSRGGLNNFIGSDFEYSVITGDKLVAEKSNKNALLICDRAGKLIAPFLGFSYDTLVVINLQEYENLTNDYLSLINKYNINDVFWIQKADEMGVKALNKSIRDLIIE